MELVLERDGHDQPWGFRLQGGADLAMPLSVQRVSTEVLSPLFHQKVSPLVRHFAENNTRKSANLNASKQSVGSCPFIFTLAHVFSQFFLFCP